MNQETKTRTAFAVRVDAFVNWILKIKYKILIRGMAVDENEHPDFPDCYEGKFIYRWQKLPKDYEWL